MALLPEWNLGPPRNLAPPPLKAWLLTRPPPLNPPPLPFPASAVATAPNNAMDAATPIAMAPLIAALFMIVVSRTPTLAQMGVGPAGFEPRDGFTAFAALTLAKL